MPCTSLASAQMLCRQRSKECEARTSDDVIRDAHRHRQASKRQLHAVVFLLSAQTPSCQERVDNPGKPCETREHDEAARDEHLQQIRGVVCCMVYDRRAQFLAKLAAGRSANQATDSVLVGTPT